MSTIGKRFTYEDYARLAALIWRRWGQDLGAARLAWCRLFENNCSEEGFLALLRVAAMLGSEDEQQALRHWLSNYPY